MENYNLLDVIPPWLLLFSLLLLIGYAEDWIHKHFYGIGYLLTKDTYSATRLFYVFFIPGVFIHEFVQYLVAGALNIPIKKVVALPESQLNGTMRLNFVVMQRDQTDLPRAMLFAASPFVIMGLLVWFLSTQMLDLHTVTAALGTGNPSKIWDAIIGLTQKADFIIGFYLLFTIANSMLPNKADAEGLPLIFSGMGALVVIMLFFGIEGALIKWLATDVATTIGLVNTALISIVLLDVIAIGSLWVIEGRLENWRGFRMDYAPAQAARQKAVRQPGSDEPLPVGTPLPSIYNFDLPMPEPVAKPAKAPVVAEPKPASIPARPSLAGQSDQVARPAFSAPAESLTEKPAARPSLAGQFDAPKTPEPARATGERPFTRPPEARPSPQRPAETPERPSGFSITPRPAENQGDLRSNLFKRPEAEAVEQRPARPTGQLAAPSRPPERTFRPAEKTAESSPLDRLRVPRSDDDDFNQDVYEENFNQDTEAGN